MGDPDLDTVRLHRCVERWQGGDRAAADELLQASGVRLEHLTRKMLRGFPNVRGMAETLDVLQGSLIRLLNSLRNLRPDSTRHFFNLAAVHIRRELLDLARRLAPRSRVEAAPDPEGEGTPLASTPDPHPVAPEDLELWSRFHEAVDRLPAEEREVTGLVFYHGWTQQQIADLFGVDERTVRRRWQSACVQLSRLLGGQLPPL